MNAAHPIDPAECRLDFKRVSEGYATLDIRIPAKYVRRMRKHMRTPSTKDGERALRTALIQFALDNVLSKESAKLITPPTLAEGSPMPETAAHHDFVCTVGLDLVINMAMPDLGAVELLLPDATVTEDLVEAEVRSQCFQFGTRHDAETVQRGCVCVMDLAFRVEQSEQPVFALTKVEVVIPDRGDFLLVQGLQAPGCVEHLLGARVDAPRSFEAVFPPNFGVPFLRVAPAHVTVVMHSIKQIEPATVETVLKEYGMPSIERLRTQIRFALEEKRSRDCKILLREQMADALPDLVKAETPTVRSRLLRAHARRQFLVIAQARGLTGERGEEEWKRQKAAIEAQADREARLKLILPSLATNLSFVMEEDLVAGRIAGIAAERGVRPEQVRAELVESGRHHEFLLDVQSEVILDKLIEMARHKSISTEAWETVQRGKFRAH